MQGKISVAAAIAALSFAGTAMAGFVASTGQDAFSYTPSPGGTDTALLPVVGSKIVDLNNPLQTYTPDTPADPQISAGDISSYLFSLDVTVISTPAAGVVRATGTYSIFYDLGPDGTPDIRVSSGTASLDLSNIVPGTYLVTGALTQTQGPANPAFRDLAYGNNANLVLQGGLYVGAGSGGTLNLVLSQKAVVTPEPVSFAAIAGTSLMVLRRRRA